MCVQQSIVVLLLLLYLEDTQKRIRKQITKTQGYSIKIWFWLQQPISRQKSLPFHMP